MPIQNNQLQKVDPNEKDNDGNTALYRACEGGHLNIVKFLIKKGAYINVKNNSGWMPLHTACLGGHVETVRFLVEKKQELDKNQSRLTELPNDITQLTSPQKAILLEETAPYKPLDPLVPALELNNKSLVDYMREEKPNLLQFAEGYYGDQIFNGVYKPYTAEQELAELSTILRINPHFVKNPELIIDRTFKNQNLIKQAGINFKQMNHAATKIQALGRGCIVRQNKIRTTSRIAI